MNFTEVFDHNVLVQRRQIRHQISGINVLKHLVSQSGEGLSRSKEITKDDSTRSLVLGERKAEKQSETSNRSITHVAIGTEPVGFAKISNPSDNWI